MSTVRFRFRSLVFLVPVFAVSCGGQASSPDLSETVKQAANTVVPVARLGAGDYECLYASGSAVVRESDREAIYPNLSPTLTALERAELGARAKQFFEDHVSTYGKDFASENRVDGTMWPWNLKYFPVPDEWSLNDVLDGKADDFMRLVARWTGHWVGVISEPDTEKHDYFYVGSENDLQFQENLDEILGESKLVAWVDAVNGIPAMHLSVHMTDRVGNILVGGSCKYVSGSVVTATGGFMTFLRSGLKKVRVLTVDQEKVMYRPTTDMTPGITVNVVREHHGDGLYDELPSLHAIELSPEPLADLLTPPDYKHYVLPERETGSN